jgi:hypothetical protein
MRTATALITRVNDRSGNLLYFRLDGLGGPGNSRYSFVDPAIMPPFEGDEAWFEVERVHARPWSFWKPVRQVEPPAWRTG